MLGNIFTLNPNRDWESRLISLRRNLALAAETILIAALIVGAWSVFYFHKWPLHAHQEPDVGMLNAAALICAAIYAIVAAFLFAQVWERTSKLSQAVLLGEEVTFMALRDEKVPLTMFVVLIFFAADTLFLLGIAGYSTWGHGAAIIFSVSCAFNVTFFAITEMQNTRKKGWISTHAPPHWLTQPVQPFFAEYRRLQKPANENDALKTAHEVLTQAA